MENSKINSSFVDPERPEAQTKKTGINFQWKIFYNTIQYMIFQYGWEPFLIQQILIGFKAILEIFHIYCCVVGQQQIGLVIKPWLSSLFGYGQSFTLTTNIISLFLKKFALHQLVQTSSIQTFPPIVYTDRRGDIVYYSWGYIDFTAYFRQMAKWGVGLHIFKGRGRSMVTH